MRSAHLLLASCAFAASCGFAGCAGPKPDYQPIIPFEFGQVATFAVYSNSVPELAVMLTVPVVPAFVGEPSEYTTSAEYIYTHPASDSRLNSGAASGAIASSIAGVLKTVMGAFRNDKLNTFLASQKFDAESYFHEALAAELAKSGHSMKLTEEKDTVTAPALRLYVDIAQYGFMNIGGPWIPTAMANVSVTTADGAHVLLRDSLVTGSPVGAMGPRQSLGNESIVLPYDPSFILANEEAITKDDAEIAIMGLKAALESLARGVADLVMQ